MRKGIVGVVIVILLLSLGCVGETPTSVPKTTLAPATTAPVKTTATPQTTAPPTTPAPVVTTPPPTTTPSPVITTIPPTTTPPPTTTLPPTTTPPPKTIHVSIEKNCMGFLLGAPEEAQTANVAGAGWARPHPGPFSWNSIELSKGTYVFDETDDWVKRVQENNIAILATIWPYADWDQAVCREKTCEVSDIDQFYPKGIFGKEFGIPKSRCPPCSMEDYTTFLGRLVERYDGDGIDDMPGLEIPVLYWEILNEPEMNSFDLTFYKGSQEEYVEILKNSYQVIKKSCPNCQVVQGGAAGSFDTETYWNRILELGGGQYFDIANIHFISHGDQSTLNVKGFKDLLIKNGVDKPIWVTEAEMSSEDLVESSFEGALDAGASKVFFTRFEFGREGPPRPGQYSKVYEKIPEKCPN